MRMKPVVVALAYAALSLSGCSCSGGDGNPDDVAVSGDSIDFGVVIAGSTCTRTLELTNGTPERVTVSGYRVTENDTVCGGENTSCVFEPGDVPSTLAASTTLPFEVSYSPTTPGTEDNGVMNIEFSVTENPGERTVSLKGYAVERRAPRLDWRCEDPSGEAGVYGACPTVVIDNVQQGQLGAAVVKLHNLGSEVLHVNRAYIESDSGRWFIDRGFFEAGEGRLEEEVTVPTQEGAAPVPIRNFVTGDCSLEPTDDPDLPLSFDITYIAREVGVDEATLVLLTDDPFRPEVRVPMQGIGNGRKGVVEPGALVVTGGDTSIVTLKSVGNTPIPINKVYLDLDGNGEQDADDFGCRPGERSEDEGALTCSSNRGSGFRLEAFDGAEGGQDEVQITIYHWGGTAQRSQLIFQSNTLGIGNPGGPSGAFVVPIGTPSDAQLTASSGDELTFTESEGLYSGSVQFTLTNNGSEDAEVSAIQLMSTSGAVAADDNWLNEATTITADGADLSLPLAVTAGGSATVNLEVSGSAGSTWPEAMTYTLRHNALGPKPLVVRFGVVTPQ